MKIPSFKGIHNVSSKRDIPDDALQDAVNVDLTNSGALISRDAYTLTKAKSISTAYTTDDNITYITSNGHLYRVASGLTLVDLGASSATEFADYQGYLFTNDGKQVYRDVVTDLVIPVPEQPQVVITGGVYPAGLYHVVATLTNADQLEGGCSQVVTVELTEPGEILLTNNAWVDYIVEQYQTDANGTEFYHVENRLPLAVEQLGAQPYPDNVDKIEYHEGRLYVTLPFGEYTEVRFSRPNLFHLFDYEADYFVITGTVLDMKSTNGALLIGTESAIYAYQDGALTQLAAYGVVPGRSMVRMPNRQVLIHTVRGICEALPFKPLTEALVSLPMGAKVNACLMNSHGIQRYVGLHDGQGEAYNQF